MDIEALCTEIKLLIKILTEEVLTAVLSEIWIIKTNHTNFQFLAVLTHGVSVAKNQMHCQAIRQFLRSRKSQLVP